MSKMSHTQMYIAIGLELTKISNEGWRMMIAEARCNCASEEPWSTEDLYQFATHSEAIKPAYVNFCRFLAALDPTRPKVSKPEDIPVRPDVDWKLLTTTFPDLFPGYVVDENFVPPTRICPGDEKSPGKGRVDKHPKKPRTREKKLPLDPYIPPTGKRG